MGHFLMSELFVKRIEPIKHRWGLLDRGYVEKGAVADWNQLHCLHYKAEVLGI